MARVNIPDLRGRRSYNFVLTPLADVMTQLLIFFMLTSNLTPFSMLTVQSGTDPVPGSSSGEASSPGEAEDPPPPPALGSALWTVEEGAVLVAGQRFDFTLLPQLAQALAAAGESRVVLTVDAGAKIQDIVSVLEALNDVEIEAVQIARGAS